MQNLFTILFIGIISLFISSCENTDKPARGAEDEIFVVADSAEFQRLRPALQIAFEKIIYTPQPEKIFSLKHIPPYEIESCQKNKNLIIIAPLNSGSNTSEFIKAVMDSNSIKGIKTNARFAIDKHNLWARNQIVMILTAPTIEELEEKITRNKDQLFNAFQEASDKRLYKSLYNADYEHKGMQGKFLSNYGWIIYIQKDFVISADEPAEKFVWIKKSSNDDMQKWVFIHWIENASPAYLNEDSIHAIRDRLTKKYYRTKDKNSYAVVSEDYYTTNETNFNGRYAIFTQGLWETGAKEITGPFINYTFYDEKSKRVYMLDAAIFAPKYYKRNLIQQVDVMLQSFMTADELSKDRREELLTAAEEFAEKK